MEERIKEKEAEAEKKAQLKKDKEDALKEDETGSGRFVGHIFKNI